MRNTLPNLPDIIDAVDRMFLPNSPDAASCESIRKEALYRKEQQGKARMMGRWLREMLDTRGFKANLTNDESVKLHAIFRFLNDVI